MKKFAKSILILLLLITANPVLAQTDTELDYKEINVGAPLNSINAEVSGFTWYKDYLIILPQFPAFSPEKSKVWSDDGYIYAIKKQDIINSINGTKKNIINPIKIKLIASGLTKLYGAEGFEAITFINDNVYLVLESKDRRMFDYLIAGKISSDMSNITLDTKNATIINTQSDIDNASDETAFTLNNQIITIHEANGKKDNLHPLHPVAHVFNSDLNYSKEITFPNIEYRITDATTPENNYFWVMNYRYPGESKYRSDKDKIFQKYPVGKTHHEKKQVERLIKLKYTDKGIEIVDTPPIQLKLIDQPRNWEALAKIDNIGFIIATDQNANPRQGIKTIFAFIAFKDK